MGFSVDPYKHQDSSAWKNKAVAEDAKLLCEFFGKSQEELEQASRAYKGEEHLLFNFIYAIRFLEYCFNEAIKDTDTMLRVLVTIFAVEAITPGGEKKKKFVRFFTQTLTTDDKKFLLKSYVFSEPVLLGTTISSLNHVMYKACSGDAKFQPSGTSNNVECSPTKLSNCCCSAWLDGRGRGQLDNFLRDILGKLYAMRCAVVHDAAPVFFVAPNGGSTLRDIFSGEGETSEKLGKLPENVQHDVLSNYRIYYKASEQLLVFKGVMKEEKKDELLKLSAETSYQEAIKRLFQRSQDKFTHYRCGLGLDEYIAIVKRAFWVFFERGCKFR